VFDSVIISVMFQAPKPSHCS